MTMLGYVTLRYGTGVSCVLCYALYVMCVIRYRLYVMCHVLHVI